MSPTFFMPSPGASATATAQRLMAQFVTPQPEPFRLRPLRSSQPHQRAVKPFPIPVMTPKTLDRSGGRSRVFFVQGVAW